MTFKQQLLKNVSVVHFVVVNKNKMTNDNKKPDDSKKIQYNPQGKPPRVYQSNHFIVVN